MGWGDTGIQCNFVLFWSTRHYAGPLAFTEIFGRHIHSILPAVHGFRVMRVHKLKYLLIYLIIRRTLSLHVLGVRDAKVY